jgi:hypothetical protein
MKIQVLASVLLSALLTTSSFAQLKKLAISDVKAGPGLIKAATSSNTIGSLERVVQAFDSQLINRMHGTRKFDILARSDLKQLVKEGDVSGSTFKIPEADYVLVTTLDDFQDYKEELVLPSTGEKLSKRVVRLTAVAKIYNSITGRLVESANINAQAKDAGGQFNSVKNSDLSDALLEKVVEQVADATANRVSDVIYPAKIISKIDKQVTINRGDGTSIVTGQIWQVWALGAELKDPDTGEVIDRERLPVGRVRITQVNPKTTLAEILEDSGITNGSIVQLVK